MTSLVYISGINSTLVWSLYPHQYDWNYVTGIEVKCMPLLPHQIWTLKKLSVHMSKGGYYIGLGDCTSTCDRSQSEVKWSRRNFGAGQTIKVGFGGSIEMVKGSTGDWWAWLIPDSQGSRPDFWCVKGSSTKIWWVKILTVVAGSYRSTGDCVVSPLDVCNLHASWL